MMKKEQQAGDPPAQEVEEQNEVERAAVAGEAVSETENPQP